MLGRVFHNLRKDFLHVRLDAALVGFLKLLADMGVEPATAGYEKRLIVDQTVVATHGATAVQAVDSGGDTDGNTEVTGKPIAAAGGHHAQGGVRTNQTASHFVDGAVAAHCHYRIEAELRIMRG